MPERRIGSSERDRPGAEGIMMTEPRLRAEEDMMGEERFGEREVDVGGEEGETPRKGEGGAGGRTE